MEVAAKSVKIQVIVLMCYSFISLFIHCALCGFSVKSLALHIMNLKPTQGIEENGYTTDFFNIRTNVKIILCWRPHPDKHQASIHLCKDGLRYLVFMRSHSEWASRLKKINAVKISLESRSSLHNLLPCDWAKIFVGILRFDYIFFFSVLVSVWTWVHFETYTGFIAMVDCNVCTKLWFSEIKQLQ